MESQVNKIIDGNVIIPKIPAWSFIFGVVTACTAAFFSLSIRVTHTEKNIETLQRDVKENSEALKKNKETYTHILSELKDINSVLQLKQDKKFLE
jgi:uncharacterized coiled-coil protein SlyX